MLCLKTLLLKVYLGLLCLSFVWLQKFYSEEMNTDEVSWCLSFLSILSYFVMFSFSASQLVMSIAINKTFLPFKRKKSVLKELNNVFLFSNMINLIREKKKYFY